MRQDAEKRGTIPGFPHIGESGACDADTHCTRAITLGFQVGLECANRDPILEGFNPADVAPHR